MAAAARALGLGLMIGAMVESPLAIATSASLAAGQGGFSFVDLDTHLFMRDIPLSGGFVQSGPLLDLSGIAAGHGVVPAG
jgi:L-alanine-DL-glutamate epimerase-like enolase superfamily enzyme